MSREFLYVEGGVPLTRFQDLQRVATTRATTDDDGREISAGAEGTIVDVVKGGLAYAVEFTEPFDTLATLLPDELRSLEDTCRER